LAGLKVTSQRTYVVTASGAQQTLREVSSDLATSAILLTEASIPGFEPIGVGTQVANPIWIRGVDASLRLSYLPGSGGVGVDATYMTATRVTEISVADYTDHVHLGWREVSGRCFGVDVDFAAQPTVAGATQLAEDCSSLRIVSGPEPHDPLVSTWTSQGGVHARYVGSSIPDGGSAFTVRVGSGRAPKISSDSEDYWVAWREGAEIQLARIDKSGQMRRSSIGGFAPVGDESFEFVKRGTSLDLVVLGTDALSFLTLCPRGP
jgi:hypothetical protein